MAKHPRYESSLANESFDVICIGSGIGSLTTAGFLARAGKKVLVLEQHYEPGGFCHTFKRKKFEWDVGVHYVGSMHSPHTIERKALDHLTDKKLEWASMGSPYDRAVIDGKAYDFVSDIHEQIELWVSYFPGEEEAIHRYWDLVRECSRAVFTFFGERAMPGLLSMAMGGMMRKKFTAFSDRTTYDVLSELTDNKTLIDVLCAQSGDYGLSPKESSFGIHALIANHYRNGASYPVGGASQIHQGLIKGIEAHGGKVVVLAPVSEILIEGGKATGVKMENGDVLRADTIVSGIGVGNTFGKLLPDSVQLPFDWRSDLKQVKRSMSHNCLYVGLNCSAEFLDLPKYNYWIYDEKSADTPGDRRASAYISFPSAKDPAWEEEHPNTATIQCIAGVNYDEVAAWGDTQLKKRGDDYDDYKKVFEAKMLKHLYALHPEIEGHVAWAEVSTPLSTKHFSGYDQGQIYGLEHTPERFRIKWLRPKTPIKGLFLTGQDVACAGVAGALFGGLLTASALLKKNMIAYLKTI